MNASQLEISQSTGRLLHEPTSVRPYSIHSIVLVVLSTLFMALCAHISVPLPFTPVPLTMQTFAVLLLGIMLGPSRATAVMTLYLAEGAIGLPVFSPHGFGGISQLFGLSGGYLLSYPVAALIVGSLFRRRRSAPAFTACLFAALLGDLAILLSGATWLKISLGLSSGRALEAGVSPFLAVEAIKVLLVAVSATVLGRTRRTPQTSIAG